MNVPGTNKRWRARDGHRRSKSRSKWRQALRSLAVPLTLAVAAPLAVVLGPAETAQASGPDPTDAYRSLKENAHPDWMAGIPDATSLASLLVPGTHDTLAVWGGVMVMTQENYEGDPDEDDIGGASYQYQLGVGIRAIDIRVSVVLDNADPDVGKFSIHHGAVYQNANFDDVLRETRAFLKAHPSETVLLNLHGECTGEIGSCHDIDPCTECAENHNERRRQIFDAYRGADKDLFWEPSATGASGVLTLGEVRGKLVLMNFSGPFGGNYTDYGFKQLNYEDWGDDDWSQRNCYVQNTWDVSIPGIAGKWEGVHAHLDRTNRGADCLDDSRPNDDKMYVNPVG